MFENINFTEVWQNILIMLENLLKQFKLLGSGALISLEIFALTLIFSLPLGLLVAFGRMSKNKFIRKIVKDYILVMRGTPLMLQLIFIYFAPAYMPEGFRFNIDRFVAAIIAFNLNYAAYFAEIYRGGIESISQGQYEAAAVLGFTKTQTFFKIILPQVIKRILPAVGNEVITLVKDTALVTTLGISELFRAARNESARIFSSTPLFIAGLFYLIMNFFVTKVFDKFEKKLSYYR
jgi:polar amino acid transport system permease protein